MSLGSATNYQFVVNYPINNISSTPHRKSKSKMAGAPCATEDQGQTKSPHPRESLHHHFTSHTVTHGVLVDQCRDAASGNRVLNHPPRRRGGLRAEGEAEAPCGILPEGDGDGH